MTRQVCEHKGRVAGYWLWHRRGIPRRTSSLGSVCCWDWVTPSDEELFPRETV